MAASSLICFVGDHSVVMLSRARRSAVIKLKLVYGQPAERSIILRVVAQPDPNRDECAANQQNGPKKDRHHGRVSYSWHLYVGPEYSITAASIKAKDVPQLGTRPLYGDIVKA